MQPRMFLLLAGLLAAQARFPAARAATPMDPIISEFMAENDGAIVDGLGDPSDWIEIYNPTSLDAQLSGWKLRENDTLWSFPATSLPAGGRLLVFASGKGKQPYTDPAGHLHTNFKLDSEGVPLALLRPDGTVAWEYANPGKQKKGVSFGIPETTTLLTTFESPARWLVPSKPVPDGWRSDPAFDDSGWRAGQASAGFGAPFANGGGTVAYRVHTTTPGNQEYGGSLGMDFTVNRPCVITELGCFDDNGDGMTKTIITQLWRRNDQGTPGNLADDAGGGVLATMSFTPTAPGVLVEGNRFKPLATPITLPRGAYTIVAYGYGTGERNGNLGGGSPPEPWETQSGDGALSFVGGGRYGTAGTFPASVDGGPSNRYAAGTFRFAGPDDPLARTQLGSAMLNINATAMMRVHFAVANPGDYQSLALRLAYNDGCAVWLNGVEVARRNAPGILAADSAATVRGSGIETVSLSAALLKPGDNLLAIQGLNISAGDPDFFMGATLAGVRADFNEARHFATPTPGAPNPPTGVLGYVSDTKFSAKRGFYETPFDLAITNATPGATIRYTLDGSAPSETNGVPYSGPIRIATTAVVRAFAFKAGHEPSNVDTHSYIFAADAAVQPDRPPAGYPASWTDYTGGGTFKADYGMVNPATHPANYARAAGNAKYTAAEARAALANSIKSLPVLSIATEATNLFDPTTGIYLHPAARGEAWERPVSVELITTNGVEDWHAKAGLHIMGLTSRSLATSPKLNMMLVFGAAYGDTWLTQPFFGDEGPKRIKRIALRSNTRDSWTAEYNGFGTATYIEDGFAKEALMDSGEPATRHRYCQVFINGMYWGLYNPTERPEAHWAETTFGGEDEDYDVIDLCCGNQLESGDMTEWQQLLAKSQAGFAADSAFQAIQGNNPDGSRNPGLKKLLGVDSFIGFAINGYYHASGDWPGNFFVVYDNAAERTGGWRFVTWDTDLGFPGLDPNANKVTPPEGFGHPWWQNSPGTVDVGLRQNAEYRMRLADRVYREFFHQGAYVTATNLARWQRLRDRVQPGLYAESARWGDYIAGGLRTVQEHWLPRVNGAAAAAFFAGRNGKVIAQLRSAGLYPAINPPEFNQFGGAVPANFQLAISNGGGTAAIYFTTDGSDPRLPGGAQNPAATLYAQPLTLAAPTFVRARAKSGATWSAVIEARFYPPQGLENLQLSEIMYNPPKLGAVDGDEMEFLELKNNGPTRLDLTGVSFTQGIRFAFTNGTVLQKGEYFLLARNPEQMAVKHPGVRVNGVYAGKLDNAGETIALATFSGAEIFSVSYNNAAPWPAEADNTGLSLQRMNFAIPASNPLRWTAAPPTPGEALPAELADSDGDGMPDGWETAHGLDPAVDDSGDDPDGDGFTNLQEFLAGTDPRSAGDRLSLQPIGTMQGPGSVAAVFGFTAVSNKTYSVVYRDFAAGRSWTNFANFPAQPTNRFVTLTNEITPESSARYFRLATPRLP